MASQTERMHALVAPILADLGLELFDLEVNPGLVRLIVERLDGSGGPDLEMITTLTRLVSRELDHADPFPGKFMLEVSSPGLERTLRSPDHFRRAVGSTVNVRTHPEVAGDRRIQGVLIEADDDGIVVRVAPTRGGPGVAELVDRRLAFPDIERAKTVFEWGPAPKPGTGTKQAGAKPGTTKPSTKKPSTKKPSTKKAVS